MSLAHLLLVPLLAALTTLAESSSSLDWVSHPVAAGEWVLLSGDFRQGASTVTLTNLDPSTADANAEPATSGPSPLQTKAVDVSPSALKFQLPPGAAGAGIFNVSVDGGAAITLNAPEVWWFQGDGGETSSPGGWLRVFGRSIGGSVGGDSAGDGSTGGGAAQEDGTTAAAISAALAAKDFAAARRLVEEAAASSAAASSPTSAALPKGTRLRLTPTDPTSTAGDVIEVAATAANTTAYHALFPMPADLPAGSYTASISNGMASGAVWTPLSFFESPDTPRRTDVTIAPKRAFKTDVFTVDCAWDQPIFTRPCGWVGARSDGGVNAALAKAKANGGGIVLLPRGQYYLDGPIVVPDGVRFRGESRELVAIHMKEAPKPQDAPTPGYIYSDGGENHAWAIEDLTVYVEKRRGEERRTCPCVVLLCGGGARMYCVRCAVLRTNTGVTLLLSSQVRLGVLPLGRVRAPDVIALYDAAMPCARRGMGDARRRLRGRDVGEDGEPWDAVGAVHAHRFRGGRVFGGQHELRDHGQ